LKLEVKGEKKGGTLDSPGRIDMLDFGLKLAWINLFIDYSSLFLITKGNSLHFIYY